jgi:cbb3-type cytochrome oxidase subunit 3
MKPATLLFHGVFAWAYRLKHRQGMDPSFFSMADE